MHCRQLRRPKGRGGLRIEYLEGRTLFHVAAIALAEGIIDISTVHGDNAIVVRWDPTSQSIAVLNNGQEQFRVAGAEVQGLNLRGLAGKDIALMDARLRMPFDYDRGADQGILREQLGGYGDGNEYYIARPGGRELAFICSTTDPYLRSILDAGRPAGTNTYSSTERLAIDNHSVHGLSSPSPLGASRMNGDGATALPNGMGTSLMDDGLNPSEVGSFGSMVTMDYAVKRGALPKWMSPG